jgi:predicted RNA-binding protein with PUA-like domain
MAQQYWLLKTEPSTYSFETLMKDGKTNWNGVRNFQARKFLQAAKKGDLALIYHSGEDKAVVGIAEVSKEGYADIDEEDGSEWTQIDLKKHARLKKPVTLAQIKATPALKDMKLVKQSRLSCMPVEAKEYALILKMGGGAT